MDLDGLGVRYAFVYGDDWNVSSGEEDGKGQYAFKGNANSQNGVKRLVWNLPFEVQFRSMNPHGWPQLVIYLAEKLSDGTDCVKAYGCGYVPIEGGTHEKMIRMYSPV